MLDAVDLALVRIERLAGLHQLVAVAALFEPVVQIHQPGVAAAAQEAAKAPLLDVGQVRRTHPARLQGDLQLVVHIVVGDLAHVELEVGIDLLGIGVGHLPEPAGVGVDEGPQFQGQGSCRWGGFAACGGLPTPAGVTAGAQAAKANAPVAAPIHFRSSRRES